MMKVLAPILGALAVSAAFAVAAAQPQPSPRVQTRNFVTAASESDQFEITEAAVVAAQSHDGRVIGFARRMKQDHATTSAALKAAAMRSGLPAPQPELGGDQQKMLSTLQSLKGPPFDRMYAKQQVLAHTQALVVQQTYASAGSDPNLRQAAHDAVPVIQHHLDIARRLRADLGG